MGESETAQLEFHKSVIGMFKGESKTVHSLTSTSL